MATIIAEKILEDGALLKIRTWISDMIIPGQQMYQLGICHALTVDIAAREIGL
jgi:hypothetical protein